MLLAQSASFFCIDVFRLTLSQMAWLGFLSPNAYAATGNRTCVGSVAAPRFTERATPDTAKSRLGFSEVLAILVTDLKKPSSGKTHNNVLRIRTASQRMMWPQAGYSFLTSHSKRGTSGKN